MTPAARVSAAITVLDQVLAGTPAEQALTGWARSSRYAGSKDRAAIRDHVFDALRRRRSAAWTGGAETGRGLMLGVLRQQGAEIADLFDGSRYGPAPAAPDEAGATLKDAPRGVRLDVPDWMLPLFDAALGAEADAAMACLRERAGVFLRVNTRRANREDAQASLEADGIGTRPVSKVKTALQITENPRKISGSAAYREGLVELQDPASQQAVLALPLADGMRVLDYCAGGGGKALAMADRAVLDITAHDAEPRRMADLPARAARAGVSIATARTEDLRGPYDLVLVDAPCSGSGTWRRGPDAKWRLTPDRLAELAALQRAILDAALPLVAPGGVLAYATCSVFASENEAVIKSALARHPNLRQVGGFRLSPAPTHDGFYLAVLRTDT